MSFYGRYELLELTRDGSVKTFAGRQKVNGREIAAHLLVGGRPVHAALMDRIEHLPATARAEILESGDHDGTPYVITAPWLRRETFNEWVTAGGAVANGGDPFAKVGTWRIPESEFGRKSAPSTRTRAMAAPAATPPFPEPKPEPVPTPAPPDDPQPGTPVVGVLTSMYLGERALSVPEPAEPGGQFTRMFASIPKPVPAEDMVTADLPLLSHARLSAVDVRSDTVPAYQADAKPSRVPAGKPGHLPRRSLPIAVLMAAMLFLLFFALRK